MVVFCCDLYYNICMKLSKQNFGDLSFFKDDLSSFLTEIQGRKKPVRLLVLDAHEKKEESVDVDGSIIEGKTEITVFDSDKIIANETKLENAATTKSKKDMGVDLEKVLVPKGIKDITREFITHRADLNEDNIIMTSATPDNEPLKKQRTFWIFILTEKPKQLIKDYLHSYQAWVIRYLYTKKRINMLDIIARKKDLLTALIKKEIDIEIITMLSGNKYEKRDLMGSLIYTKDKDDAKYKVKFSKKIEFRQDNMRLLRKIFEMSDNDKSIIVHDKFVTGLGTREQIYKKVTFLGNQKWSLNISNRNTIRFAQGKYYIDDTSTLSWEDLPKNFMLKKFEKHFNELVTLLASQKHGALLIISDKAKQEVERLSELDRGYAIAPLNLKEHRNIQLVTNLSNVDGAVFIDTNLICHGSGIILDGIAKRPGLNARGSRYNSTRCYLDNKEEGNFVAIVFSEDETIDLLTNIDN